MENNLPLKELLYKLADNQLIYGHRNSEWIGLGPLLEEDISFASIAQDKVGQSRMLYTMLQQLGESDPDTIAFMRNASQFHCCHLVQYPTINYEEALVRHFLFDHAEKVIFGALRSSSSVDLAAFAVKFAGEINYHVLHADSIIKKMANGTEESKIRIANALAFWGPDAFAIFEPGPYEAELVSDGIATSSASLQATWVAEVNTLLAKYELPLLSAANQAAFGGRGGHHTEHLQPMLDEMAEVYRLDPTAEW